MHGYQQSLHLQRRCDRMLAALQHIEERQLQRHFLHHWVAVSPHCLIINLGSKAHLPI